MQTITAEELKKILTGDDRTPVINVLKPDDYEKRHIPSTINIPLDDQDFVNRVQERIEDKSRPVIVYCAKKACDASEKAAKQLERAGFTQVKDYAEGTEGWKSAGYRVEGSAAEH